MSPHETTVPSANPGELAYTSPERLAIDFTSRGLVVLSPESLGIPLDIHHRIYQQEKQAVQDRKRITPSLIPEVLEVINSPGLVAACNQLVGENWAIVPFTHNASFTSGSRDQHWHKDDNGPPSPDGANRNALLSTSGARRYGPHGYHPILALLDL